MKQEVLKEKSNEIALLKIEKKVHTKRTGNFAKLAKSCANVKPKDYAFLVDTLYSSTDDAKERQSHETTIKDTKLEKLVKNFIFTLASLEYIGEASRMTNILAGVGIKVTIDPNVVAASFVGNLTGKKLDKFTDLWNSEFAGMDIPFDNVQKVKTLVNAGVAVRSDIENLNEKTSKEVIEGAAGQAEVKPPTMSKAIDIRVTEINDGPEKAEEKVKEIIERNDEMNNALSCNTDPNETDGTPADEETS